MWHPLTSNNGSPSCAHHLLAPEATWWAPRPCRRLARKSAPSRPRAIARRPRSNHLRARSARTILAKTFLLLATPPEDRPRAVAAIATRRSLIQTGPLVRHQL